MAVEPLHTGCAQRAGDARAEVGREVRVLRRPTWEPAIERKTRRPLAVHPVMHRRVQAYGVFPGGLGHGPILNKCLVLAKRASASETGGFAARSTVPFALSGTVA